MNKELLNTRELAEYLDINEKKIYNLIMDKGLPATKVTGKWLFPKHLVDVWIDNHIQNYPWMKEKALQTFTEALIIAGSNDILLADALSLFQEKQRNILPLYSSIGSMRGINALKKGWCHMCAAHMLQKEDEEYNLAYIKDMVEEKCIIINFAYRTQGLIVSGDNKKNIRGVRDMARNDVRIANRQSGTGTRFLLDYELEKEGIDAKSVNGYDHICLSHLDIGIEVLARRVDAGLGIQSIAQMFGLTFIPLRKERFDLIMSKKTSSEKKTRDFIQFLRSPGLRRYSERFAGYDLKDTGEVIWSD
ncbi:MAG: substrate-binding domain-containing protein [bacterium]